MKIKISEKMRNQNGSTLLVSFLLIVFLLVVGSAALVLTTSEIKTSERQYLSAKTFHIAEAGVERVMYDLKKDIEDVAVPSWQDNDINGTTFDLSTSYTTFLTSTFAGGSYVVSLKEGDEPEHAWIESVATYGDVTQTVEAYVKLIDVSPWDNAIFAGEGAAGSMVNGNVDVRGSVHILGTGLADTDLAIDLGGTAEFVGNNYTGVDPALEAKIPALDTVVYNSETVETLHAELRVKRGVVGLSGSSTVGEPDQTGDDEKELVDGVYVTDGWSGSQGASSVYSDNGTVNGYDMGDSVDFPSLSDPEPEDTSRTRQKYFEDNALILTTELSALTPNSVIPFTSDGTNSIEMSGGVLTINGRVYIDDGNGMAMNTAGSDKTITYAGKGTILAEGDVQINVNLVTSGNNSYPTNILGVMTPGTIGFNQANIDVMGVFYGEYQIRVEKQTDIMGTIVSNYFDMGTNVPAIYQVPATANNLPVGMIAAGSKSFAVVAWRRK